MAQKLTDDKKGSSTGLDGSTLLLYTDSDAPASGLHQTEACPDAPSRAVGEVLPQPRAPPPALPEVLELPAPAASDPGDRGLASTQDQAQPNRPSYGQAIPTSPGEY